MGGKNHLLNPRVLNALYQESLLFNEEAEMKLKVVQNELNKLNDTLLRMGSIAAQTITLTRTSVLNMTDSAGVIKEALESTQMFIQSRLADAVLMDKRLQAHSTEASNKPGKKQRVEVRLRK